MLEYCLAYALNNNEQAHIDLTTFINQQTFKFLDHYDEINETETPIRILKKQAIRLQKYEPAMKYRDLEKEFELQYIQLTWPNLSAKGYKDFIIKRLKELDLP